jgi:LysR family glycine cleavage system transcriptional activator
METLLTNNIQLNWLRTFASAGEHLSFTLAASELNMSQSAVSQQIQLLEHHLKQKLFVRANRTIKLTDAGRAFLPLVLNSLVQLNSGAAQIFTPSNDAVVDVNVNTAFSVLWLSSYLMNFNELYPQITIRQQGSNWAADFKISTAQLEIRYGSGDWAGFESFELVRPKLRAYCTVENAKIINSLEDIVNFSLLEVIGTPQGWDKWIDEMGVKELSKNKSHARQYMDSYATAAMMSANGAGICLMYDELMQEGILADKLVPPFADSIDTEGTYYLCHRSDKALSVAARLFKEWLLSNKTR